jgi:hypothetical protein
LEELFSYLHELADLQLKNNLIKEEVFSIGGKIKYCANQLLPKCNFLNTFLGSKDSKYTENKIVREESVLTSEIS